MTTLYIVLLILGGFAILVLTFASASKLAEHIRPFVGIGLLIAPIVTFMLDFTVWAIAESLMTVAFFMFYPSDQIRGILAPIVVLVGCLIASLMLIGLSIILVYNYADWVYNELPNPLETVWWVILYGTVGSFLAVVLVVKNVEGLNHIGKRMRFAVRVLGQNG
jgi:hypothetical protein